jgi:mRNA-degrading endonuclease YafQ of YafQ-DinJ toxin-antitoxin module
MYKCVWYVCGMWLVEFESSKVEIEVTNLMRARKLTEEDRLVITTWIRVVTEEGPERIQKEKRWDDHALVGEWKGYRSSCFSKSGRIIYKIENKVIKILIARITPDHDYKRPK